MNTGVSEASQDLIDLFIYIETSQGLMYLFAQLFSCE